MRDGGGATHAPKERRIRGQKLHVVGWSSEWEASNQPTLRSFLRRKVKSEEATADTLTMAYGALGSAFLCGRRTHFTMALWKPGDRARKCGMTLLLSQHKHLAPQIRGRRWVAQGLGVKFYTILDSHQRKHKVKRWQTTS